MTLRFSLVNGFIYCIVNPMVMQKTAFRGKLILVYVNNILLIGNDELGISSLCHVRYENVSSVPHD